MKYGVRYALFYMFLDNLGPNWCWKRCAGPVVGQRVRFGRFWFRSWSWGAARGSSASCCPILDVYGSVRVRGALNRARQRPAALDSGHILADACFGSHREGIGNWGGFACANRARECTCSGRTVANAVRGSVRCECPHICEAFVLCDSLV